MNQYIKSVFGVNVQVSEYKLPSKMPQYLVNDYAYRKYIIEDKECLFVIPNEFSFTAYKKHYLKISEITGLPVVLQLNGITAYQRKALIGLHMPFVVERGQIYLPFLGVLLTENVNSGKKIEKFTPMTQLVFLYLFYHKIKMTATEAAQKTGCTLMSASRAYKALTDCGLFRIERDGVKKYIVPNSYGGELLRNAERFFIDPVEKRFCVQGSVEAEEGIASGIYALSRKTMLAATASDRCYAVYRKGQFDGAEYVPGNFCIGEEDFIVEKWLYDPSVLAEEGNVDDISLVLSLGESDDERVQAEIEFIRSKYEW